jgi:hypothetical protein
MQKHLFSIGLLFILAFSVVASVSDATEEFPVGPPPITEGLFPCSNCHASMEVNRKKRELKDEHTDIRLHHAETMRWCLDCHDAKDRDKLRLYNGELVPFTESYKLCGECHGNIYEAWRAGIHGKRIGYFSGGQRTYFLCANCHNPHDPKFKPIKPEPAPYPPTDNRNGR